jgi:hypothetical protein
MIPMIDARIMYNNYYVDMLRNLSLSSCASQIKYALAYKDFDINKDDSVNNYYRKYKPYELSKDDWK